MPVSKRIMSSLFLTYIVAFHGWKWHIICRKFVKATVYRVSCGFLSVLIKDLIPEAFPSQKCCMNMGLILHGYGDIGV